MIFPRLSAQLGRFNRTSPLRGRRIVITRAAAQSDGLLHLLAVRGATPVLYPCISILAVEDPALLDAAILDAVSGAFELIVLTSANTVEQIHARLRALGIPPFVFASLRFAAVGAATAQKAVERWGAVSVQLPEYADAVSLAAIPGLRSASCVLLPQSDRAKPHLAATLAACGIAVRVVTAYRTVPSTGGVQLAPLLAARRVDVISFASPSAVSGFIQRMQAEAIDRARLVSVAMTCIGPSTRRAAEDAGLNVSVVPPDPSLDQWVASLEDFYRG